LGKGELKDGSSQHEDALARAGVRRGGHAAGDRDPVAAGVLEEDAQ